jgi:hypothetical protein
MSVSDDDIWRAANKLMEMYGDKAAMEAAMRSNIALEAGDIFNYELWQAVMNCANELDRRKRLGPRGLN